ncbi:hypothetical protein Q5752_006483 [Cryptotrichosporon argae]
MIPEDGEVVRLHVWAARKHSALIEDCIQRTPNDTPLEPIAVPFPRSIVLTFRSLIYAAPLCLPGGLPVEFWYYETGKLRRLCDYLRAQASSLSPTICCTRTPTWLSNWKTIMNRTVYAYGSNGQTSRRSLHHMTWHTTIRRLEWCLWRPTGPRFESISTCCGGGSTFVCDMVGVRMVQPQADDIIIALDVPPDVVCIYLALVYSCNARDGT